MRKEISHFEIYAEGERKSEHPTGFQNITIMIHVKSEGLTDAEMVRAIQSMEGICPVLSMVNEKVDVQTMFQIVS
jgi:uncharacterized OsmC-like protein